MNTTTLSNQANQLEQIEQGNTSQTYSSSIEVTYTNQELISTQNMTIGTWVVVVVGLGYFIKWALR